MGLGFVGANMGLGFGWWRRALAVGSILDGECFGRRRRFDREVCIGWQRSGTGKKKANRRNRKSEFSFLYYWILCIIRFFFKIKFFFLNNADVENCGGCFDYIYIYIYRLYFVCWYELNYILWNPTPTTRDIWELTSLVVL